MNKLTENDYIINVGPGGTFQKSGDFQTIPNDIDNMFARFERDNTDKIAIYFHGGLVNERSGIATANKLQPLLSSTGCSPVFFVWETGLVETLSTNLSKISETQLFNKLIKVILKRVTEKLGINPITGRSGNGTGFSEEEIQTELLKPEPFASYNQPSASGRSASINSPSQLAGREVFIEAALASEIADDINSDREFQEAIKTTKLTVDNNGGQTGSRGVISFATFIGHAVKIAFRSIKRFMNKRDHGLFPTVVEEILREFYIAELGAWVWKAMKDKAEGMWKENTGRQGNNQYAGRYFLDKLSAFKQKYPRTKIHIIGHSAGSIATCHMLRNTASLTNSFAYSQILFMAPACRVDLFKSEMADHPERYSDLRIFTMTDENECNDKLVPYFYTHSLLYLISGILEDDGESFDAYILGLERDINFLSPYNIPELDQVHQYLFEDSKFRLSLSKNDLATPIGMRTKALKHGDFNDDPDTLLSIQLILS